MSLSKKKRKLLEQFAKGQGGSTKPGEMIKVLEAGGATITAQDEFAASVEYHGIGAYISKDSSARNKGYHARGSVPERVQHIAQALIASTPESSL